MVQQRKGPRKVQPLGLVFELNLPQAPPAPAPVPSTEAVSTGALECVAEAAAEKEEVEAAEDGSAPESSSQRKSLRRCKPL
jgi:hypothetical protein